MLWRVLRMRQASDGAGRGAPHDAAAVRAGQSDQERLELLLRLPVPAAAAAPIRVCFHALLPQVDDVVDGSAMQASPRTSWPGGGAVAPRFGGSDAARCSRSPPTSTSAPNTCERDRRLPDGPGTVAYPGFRRPGATATCGRRGRRGRGNIFGRSEATIALRAQARAGDAAHQHHPATSATTRGAASTCRCPSWAVRREAQEILSLPYSNASRADALPGRARAPLLHDEAGPAARTDRDAAEAGTDDGQHLPHAAARDRGRRLPGVLPAHLADADPQAWIAMCATRTGGSRACWRW